MNNEPILIRNTAGDLVAVTSAELTEAFLKNACTLFGMDMPSIITLRTEYLKRGGSLAITPERIREVFRA